MRRQLAPVIVGHRIDHLEAAPQARFDHVELAQGQVVTDLRRRGKYLLAGLVRDARGSRGCPPHVPSGGERPDQELVMHLGMTGSFRVRGSAWTPDAYVRATFHLSSGQLVDFRDVRRFGRLAVVEAGRYDGIATLAALGPEPLSDQFDPDRFAADLRRTTMPVKPYLLTQRPVAGVGNIYADEALWAARIDPRSRRVGRTRAHALWSAIREVLAAAVEREGTTFRDYRMVNGESGRNADHLAAYGQEGRPCARCGRPLRKIVLGGRGTTFCPRCQRP